MTEPSPYQSPESELNEHMAVPYEKTPIRRADAGRGAAWFFDGYKRLFRAPGIWLAIGLLNLLLLLLFAILSLIPVVGSILSYLFYPVLVAGFMYACKNQDQDNMRVSDLFAGFSHQTSQLFISGAIYIAMMIGLLIIAMIVVFGVGISIFAGLEIDPQSSPEEFTLIIVLFVLVFVGLSLPIIMAMWFTPALIILGKMDPIESIKSSFIACLRNFLPYLVYGLVAIFFYVGVSVILMLAIGLTAMSGNEPVFSGSETAMIAVAVGVSLLMITIVAPATFISIYSAYIEVFSDSKE